MDAVQMRTGFDATHVDDCKTEVYALVKIFMREAVKTAIDRNECTGLPIDRKMIREALVQHTIDPRGCGAELEKYLTASMHGVQWVAADEEPTALAIEAAAEMSMIERCSYSGDEITDDILTDLGDGPTTCFCDNWEKNVEICKFFIPASPIQAITKKVLDELEKEISSEK